MTVAIKHHKYSSVAIYVFSYIANMHNQLIHLILILKFLTTKFLYTYALFFTCSFCIVYITIQMSIQNYK